MQSEDMSHYFKTVHYPVGRRELRQHAVDTGAPQDILDKIDRLPEQSSFRALSDITKALGEQGYGGVEEERERGDRRVA